MTEWTDNKERWIKWREKEGTCLCPVLLNNKNVQAEIILSDLSNQLEKLVLCYAMDLQKLKTALLSVLNAQGN